MEGLFRMSRSPLLGVALMTAFPAVVVAETQAETQRLGLRARAARRTSAVQLDGRLDDAAWSDAPSTRGFWQRFPNEGQPPSLDTEFRVLYDDDALYVGVRAMDDEPEGIRGLLTRRDVASQSDWLMVGIDSYHDRRTAFVFAINPAGVQRDMLIYDDALEDTSWDAVWTAATQVTADGWVAEFRIPLSQLRFAAMDQQEWGLQVIRLVARSGEETAWTPMPRSSPKVVSQFGTLGGIDNVKTARRMELLPYVSGGAGLLEGTDRDDPFDSTTEMRGNIGLDVKYGLSSAVTLSATINPDFGQVEADPSQVNLSGRELFFAEKRPFFLEGTDIFRFSLGQGDSAGTDALFYTRRIGAAPHLPASDDFDYTDEPDTTTIFGAAKISGKTSNGWSFGMLDAVTSEETARYLDPDTLDADGNPRQLERAIEPLTNYAVARVRKDLRGGKTQIGLAATSVHRDNDQYLGELLHDRAYTGGAELQHRFWDDHWSTNLRLAGSWVHGTKEAIEETQTKLRHLYQRPDADHIELDPNRTSLAGLQLLGELGKIDGGHWRFATGADARTPGFEANDIGFHRNADYYIQWLWTQYRDDQPGGQLASYAVNLNAWTVSDWAPQYLGTGGNVNGNVTLKNQWGGGGGFMLDFPRWEPSALRGGPALRVDPGWEGWLNLRSDPRRRVSFTSGGWLWRRETGDTWSAGGNLGVTLQARSNLDVFVGPSFEVRNEDWQYVDELADSDDRPHYVFARIRQVSTGMTVRGSWTFSPTLSLQVYAQPFISSGKYEDYKESQDPGARAYEDRFHELTAAEATIDREADEVRVDRNGDGASDYSFELPDFNFRELRSNVVLRWEYLPGSTVFFIWTHGRSEEVDDGRYRGVADLSDLGQATGEHLVMVKANYWIGL
jgi:hypothetical protein